MKQEAGNLLRQNHACMSRSVTDIRTGMGREYMRLCIFPGCGYAQEEEDRIVHEKDSRYADMHIRIQTPNGGWLAGSGAPADIMLPTCLTRPTCPIQESYKTNSWPKLLWRKAFGFWQKESRSCQKTGLNNNNKRVEVVVGWLQTGSSKRSTNGRVLIQSFPQRSFQFGLI